MLIIGLKPPLWGQEEPLQQKLDCMIAFNFNETTNAWDQQVEKDAYTYNTNHQEETWTHFSWDGAMQAWKAQYKRETAYNRQGLIGVTTMYEWLANSWELKTMSEYFYDYRNKLEEVLIYTWIPANGRWQLSKKKRYRYDTDGKCLAENIDNYLVDTETWALVEMNEYTYINGSLIHYIYSSTWDNVSKKWDYSRKQWYLYTPNWELYELHTYRWNNTKTDWSRISLRGYAYDDNGDFNGHGTFYWDEVTTKYDKTLRERYQYDGTIEYKQLKLPYDRMFDQFYFHHKVDTRKLLVAGSGNSEEQYQEIRYCYSPVDQSTDVDKLVNSKITIFPNPAAEFLYVEYSGNNNPLSFELYNLQGKKVLSLSKIPTLKIDVRHIAPGVYVYRIVNKQNTESGKLVIE